MCGTLFIDIVGLIREGWLLQVELAALLHDIGKSQLLCCFVIDCVYGFARADSLSI